MTDATDGRSLVSKAEQEIDDGATDLGAAYLLHPRWQQVDGFRDRAVALRNDIRTWLNGLPEGA